MLRLAVLASGGGSNLQAILDASESGELGRFKPVLVVVDRECGAIGRGMDAGVDTVLLDRRIHGASLSQATGRLLEEYRIDFVALAGWLSILDIGLTSAWEQRMVNIHPSLLPSFGGPGMYGVKVHQAVINAGEPVSGCSVHYVSAGVDEGEVIDKVRVPVSPGDSPEDLARRVLAEEHRLYPDVLRRLSLDYGG